MRGRPVGRCVCVPTKIRDYTRHMHAMRSKELPDPSPLQQQAGVVFSAVRQYLFLKKHNDFVVRSAHGCASLVCPCQPRYARQSLAAAVLRWAGGCGDLEIVPRSPSSRAIQANLSPRTGRGASGMETTPLPQAVRPLRCSPTEASSFTVLEEDT